MKKIMILFISILILFVFGCTEYKLNIVEYYDRDLTNEEIGLDELKIASFNENTIWPTKNDFDDEINPTELMLWGAKPYLNINKIHDQGITGQNIHIAILDEGLNKEHIDFRNCLFDYQESKWNKLSTIHGTIVTSILCGEEIGVAPGVKLHYYAVGAKNKSDSYYALIRSLKKIKNYNLKSEEKIKIISMSIGKVDDIPGYDKFLNIIKDLESQGVMVFHVSKENRINAALRFPLKGDRNNVEEFNKQEIFAGIHGSIKLLTKYNGRLYLPCAGYTVADYKNNHEHMFIGESCWGNSWNVPIIAGLAALALEVNESLTKEEILNSLYETGDRFYLGRIPNPIKFIENVKNI